MDALAFASLSSLLRSLDVRGSILGDKPSAAAPSPFASLAPPHAARAAPSPVAVQVIESAAGWLISAPAPGVGADEADVALAHCGTSGATPTTLHLRAGRLHTQLRCVPLACMHAPGAAVGRAPAAHNAPRGARNHRLQRAA
jgi:hypothetical protein